MRVVFMGTPDFAVPSLRALADAHCIVSVFTQPDRRRGRGSKLIASPVKQAASELGLEVRQPQGLAGIETHTAIASDEPDVICVAAYGMILPPAILAIPRYGCLNIHASLLPKYRGAAPIHRAILDGANETGVVIMRMEEGLDTGPYSHVYRTDVGEKTVGDLDNELAQEGARLLLEALDDLETGTLTWTPQNEDAATYAPKITGSDVRLSPDLDTTSALRRVRASTRSARAKVVVGDCVLDTTALAPSTAPLAPGETRSLKDALLLGFADGALLAEEIRPEGRACMSGCDWARGAQIPATCHWSAL